MGSFFTKKRIVWLGIAYIVLGPLIYFVNYNSPQMLQFLSFVGTFVGIGLALIIYSES